MLPFSAFGKYERLQIFHFSGRRKPSRTGCYFAVYILFTANLDPPVRHQLKNRCVPWKSKKTVPVECVSLISVMRNISKLVFLFTRDVTAPSSFVVFGSSLSADNACRPGVVNHSVLNDSSPITKSAQNAIFMTTVRLLNFMKIMYVIIAVV